MPDVSMHVWKMPEAPAHVCPPNCPGEHPSVFCPCEHADHFDGGPGHVYGAPVAPEGQRLSAHVGRVCADCAQGHMADFLVDS